MKTIILTMTLLIISKLTFAQIDSVAFIIPKLNFLSLTIDKSKTVNTKNRTFLIDEKCTYAVPKYNELTGLGQFRFKSIKSDAQASLSALGSSLSVDKKSTYYIFYFNRTKTYSCPENSDQNKMTFGVGVYVIFKTSQLKVKVDINTPYDIAAAAELGLISVELDVRTIGMTPDLQNEFTPEKLSDLDIESAKYFDKITNAVRTKINNQNTIPDLIPLEL